MRRPRRLVRQRSRFFVGCEGESERGYVALLARLADAAGLAVHLDSVLLQPGGGDPCAIVELAAERIAQRERQHGDPYKYRVVFLDADKRGLVPDRDARCQNVAAQAYIHCIWQQPCHEALLLRHLDGCAKLRPQTTPVALQNLIQRWPNYVKGLAAARLADRLDLAAVLQAAKEEKELAQFLDWIGLR